MIDDFPSPISVIGLGYIGLPTAAMFASRKVPVVGVDVNQTAVDTINEALAAWLYATGVYMVAGNHLAAEASLLPALQLASGDPLWRTLGDQRGLV